MSVLFLVTPIKKNRESFTDATLLNSNRVVDFTKDEQYPLSRTHLYYNAGDGERGATWEWTLSHASNTIATRMLEDETNRVIKVNVLYYKLDSAREKPTTVNTRIWELNSDAIVWAYDISATQCYCYINRGLQWVRLTLSHTVADLSRAYSTSASLSRS